MWIPLSIMPAVWFGAAAPGIYLRTQVVDYTTTMGLVETHSVRRSSKSQGKNSSETTNYAAGTYLYQVDGQTYRGERLELFPHNHGRNPGGALLALNRDFPIAREVTVHYDPNMKSGSYLVRGDDSGGGFEPLLWSGLWMAATLLLIALFDRKSVLKHFGIMLFTVILMIVISGRDQGLLLGSDRALVGSQDPYPTYQQISKAARQDNPDVSLVKLGMSLEEVLQIAGHPLEVDYQPLHLKLAFRDLRVGLKRESPDEPFIVR